MTDNRTNEPTEAQVEAAAKAAYGYAQENATVPMPHREWESLGWIERGHFEGEARAALEAAARAAQGAAPLPGQVQKAAEIDNLPAESSIPVLPSGGVDEDALAEVIGSGENYTRDIGFGGWTLSPRLAARAVAEWLKGQGDERRTNPGA